MTRAVFAARQQTSQATIALIRARDAVKNGSTVSEACQKHYRSVGPTSPESVLQRWLKLPESTIEKCDSGFYLKTKREENWTLSGQEEDKLVARVLNESHKK